MAANNPIIIEKFGQPLTGTWSITDLAKMPITATVGILSRYMAGRVNPYTGVVGEQLCRSFRLGQSGHKNIEKALSSLKVVTSIGDTLEFGFGIEDIVRSMARSEGGSMCLALCAALKDTYSDEVCVDVLLEFANLSNVDGQWMPSGSEWKNLLEACAGALSATTFSLRAEHLMRLLRQDSSVGAADRGSLPRPKAIRTCSSPKSIAEALFILAQISRNSLQAVTFVGGSDAGWLAAVAEWFLDLRVAIVCTDGNIHYANCAEPDDVQVQVVHGASTGNTGQIVQCVGKTYRLEDALQLFSAEMRPASDARVSGRLEWKHALSSAFLADYKTMMDDPQTIGELIGSAARLFKALGQGSRMFSFLQLKACISYCDQSYGRGFINNILQWFPELSRLGDAMSKAVSRKVEQARRTYDHCIALTKERCGCSLCRCKWTYRETDFDGDREMTPAPGSAEGEEDDLSLSGEYNDTDDDRYCLVAVAETIIILGRALANVSLESKELYPQRSGFELAYGRQVSLRYTAEMNKKDISERGQIAFVLDFDSDFSLGTVDAGEEAGVVRLQTILELFTGRDAPTMPATTSAISVNGVCAFLGILSEPSEDRAAVGRIHVLPGRIEYQKKNYDRIEDRVLLRDEADDFTRTMKIACSEIVFGNRALRVKESLTALHCLLELPDSEKDRGPLLVGPGTLATLLASRRGLIPCQSVGDSRTKDVRKLIKGCDAVKIGSPDEIDEARRRSASLNIGGKSVDVLRCRDSKMALAALASAAYLQPNCSVYLADKECLDCCIRAVMAVNRPEKSHFGIFLLPSR